MDNCLPACSCDDYQGATKADIDRFTDKIENVLNDEKGRKLFRNFMFSSNMREGRKVLDFWEHVERMINSKEDMFDELDILIDEAENTEEIDLATMLRLTEIQDSGNREELPNILKILKAEATKALKREYNAFRRQFIKPSK